MEAEIDEAESTNVESEEGPTGLDEAGVIEVSDTRTSMVATYKSNKDD